MEGIKEFEHNGHSGHKVIKDGRCFLGTDSYSRACAHNGLLLHQERRKKEVEKTQVKKKKKKSTK